MEKAALSTRMKGGGGVGVAGEGRGEGQATPTRPYPPGIRPGGETLNLPSNFCVVSVPTAGYFFNLYFLCIYFILFFTFLSITLLLC